MKGLEMIEEIEAHRLEEIYDTALIGYSSHDNKFAYNSELMVDIIMNTLNIGFFEAIEHFDFNFLQAKGEGYPIYIESLSNVSK